MRSATGLTTRSAVSRPDFAKSLAHFAALKRTASFNEQQIEIWYRGLCGFSIEVINFSLLSISMLEKDFPDFGHVYQACRRRAIQRGLMTEAYCPNGSPESAKFSFKEIEDIGDNLGLKVR